MTAEEATVLTHGELGRPIEGGPKLPPDAVIGAGYIAAVSRLGVPSLRETDAGLGVGHVGGLRHDDGATPLPSGLAMAATWDPALVERGGAMIGAEAHAKGFNVMLAGGMNLIRDPRGGRTFEYFSEDPLLSGLMGAAQVKGVQSNRLIATVKHFALNAQDTGRRFADAQIPEAAARESDLLAFQIAIERGDPGAVMCAFNRVNGTPSCANRWLLNDVLKRDWGFRGYVMSDWGATPGVAAALAGLDQQSGAQLDPKVWFDAPLREAAAADPAYQTRLNNMNERILRSIYANGLDRDTAPRAPIDHAADERVAEEVAERGIVLLHNKNGALPLAASAHRIAVIGGFAGNGVLAGGGSSGVQMKGGPAVSFPMYEDGPFAIFLQQTYQRSIPLRAIRARAPGAEVTYRNGAYLADAVAAARKADVAIVFATQFLTEGFDLPDLSLPNGQDALIAAVAKANPRTIVVLENGTAVRMPWLSDVAAVLAAWYPGGRGGEAIASVLFGATNPSGRLPITFPADVTQLPRPVLPGSDTLEPNPKDPGRPGETLPINYSIEGSDVGYRWFARQGTKPLFPFGFGLSYTSFAYSGARFSADAAHVTVVNSGRRSGAEVVQLYLTGRPGGPTRRLVGFSRVELKPGESRIVSVPIEKRLLADWTNKGWSLAAGRYDLAFGRDAGDSTAAGSVRFNAQTWR
jgi:beta-glucosidase